MLELFAKHGGFDLKLMAKGDLDVDQHHTVEDAGIVIGQLFSQALGKRKGINRAGYFVLPMDETLACGGCRSGRDAPALVYKDRVKVRLVGDPCRRNWWKISLAGLFITPAPTFTRRCSTGARTITKSKPFSSALRALCATPARWISNSRDQLPSTKGTSLIGIFDYGAGNLRSVQNTLDEIGATYALVRDAVGLERASKIVLPGVGHFGQMLRVRWTK